MDLEGEDKIIRKNGDAMEPNTSKQGAKNINCLQIWSLGKNMGKDMDGSTEKEKTSKSKKETEASKDKMKRHMEKYSINSTRSSSKSKQNESQSSAMKITH